MYAGDGAGHECAGCDEIIDEGQVEYETVYEDGQAFRLHLGCASLLDTSGDGAHHDHR
jgi:hypothetical protein